MLHAAHPSMVGSAERLAIVDRQHADDARRRDLSWVRPDAQDIALNNLALAAAALNRSARGLTAALSLVNERQPTVTSIPASAPISGVPIYEQPEYQEQPS